MVTRKTKLMSGFVALIMLVSMFAMFVIPASAAGEGGIVAEKGLIDATAYPDITAYASGTNTYSVKDRAGMDKLADLVNNGNKMEGVTIYQIADIDMLNTPFEGIGHGNVTAPFNGTFDGNGFTIDNLFYYRGSEGASDGNALFPTAEGATFRNIGISGGLVVGGKWTGALLGRGSMCKIINCWNAATVVGTSANGTGGLAGTNINGTSLIANSFNVGMVYCNTGKASGIVGWINSPSDSVINTYNAGEMVTGITDWNLTTAEGHTYAPIACQDLTKSRGTANAYNYYILGRGGAQMSSYELVQNGATTIPGTESALDGSNDGAIGLDASELTGALSQNLNAHFVAEGNTEDYNVTFENVDGVGYPVLTYWNGSDIVAQRYAKDTTNVNGDKTWENASPFFKSIVEARSGALLGEGVERPTTLTLTNADDLFLLGLVMHNVSPSTFGFAEINLAADIDFAAKTVNPGVTYGIPFGNPGGHFNITFDGKSHVIKNWNYYAYKSKGHWAGGFITETGNGAVIKNLGLLDAKGIYVYGYGAADQGYQYASMLVERAGGTTVIDNCFVTGHIVSHDTNNANNHGAVFSTTWGDNIKVSNCWSKVTIETAPGTVTGIRTLGKLPTSQDYTGDMVNNYNFNTFAPGLNADNQANTYDLFIGDKLEYGTKEAAYWLSTEGGMTQLWTVKDGDIVFGTAENAVRKVTVNKMMNATTVAESIYTYYLPGEQVTIEAIPGYALDEATIPAGGTAEGFTMGTQDVTISYLAQGADYSVAEGILDKYAAYDPDLMTNGEDLAAIIETADTILAMKEQEQTPAVINNALQATAILVQMDEAFVPVLKNVYPYYPNAADRELYKDVHDGKNWAVSTYDDWAELVKMANVEKNQFTGVTIHLINDVDMGNEPVAPLAVSNGASFKGTLDGHGYVFKNLNVSYAVTGSDRWVGLIGSANSATVKNLGIAGGTVKITASSTTSEAFAAGLVAEGWNCRLYNCWNAATVDAGPAYATASGLGRFTGNTDASKTNEHSVIDGCFNVGDVITLPGSGSYAGGISGYTQGTTNVFNSFAASKKVTGRTVGMIRYNGGAKEAFFGNSYSVGYLLDGQNTHAGEADYELNYADYESGKIAYLLNAGYVAGKGGERVWYTNDPANKTVSFGTEETQTRMITILSENEEYHYMYAAQGSTVTLDFPATGNKVFVLANNVGTLNGDQLTVGAGDAIVVVGYDGVYTAALENAIAYFDSFNTEVYSVAGGKTVAAVIAEAEAKIADGSITPEEVASYTALLTADVTLSSSVSPEQIANRYVLTKGFLSPNYYAYLGARVDVYGIDDLREVQNYYPWYTADMTIALKEDLPMTDEDKVASLYASASFDGEGHTISGLNAVAAFYGNGSASMTSFKNVVFEDCSLTTSAWNSGFLWNQMSCNDLTIEGVTFNNCTFTKNNGANGFGAIVGQIPGGKKLTLKDITFTNNTVNRNCSSQGNNGGLTGPVNGVIIVDGVTIADNTYAGTSAAWGDAVVCGELVSAGNSISNVLITRNKFTGSAVNGIVSGVHKATATATYSNIVVVDNESLDGIPVQGGIANGSAAPVYTNVLTDTDGSVATEAITGGAKLYEQNKAGVAKTFGINEKGVTFATEGLPVKVEFVAQEENMATLYTDVNGNLVGLTNDLLNAAEWDDEANLPTKVFTADSVVEGSSIPEHEHIWGAPTNIAGTDTHLYECTWTDGTWECNATQTGTCIFAPVASEFEGKPEDAAHVGTCICENTKETKCSEDAYWTHTVVTPDCENPGSIDAACDYCGYSYHEDLDAIGHAYGEWAHVEGTNTHKQVCANNCGIDKVEDCFFTGEAVVVDPTREEAGSATVPCDFGCGNAQVEILPAIAYITASSEAVEAGETVEVLIDLHNVRGVSGAQIAVTYDHRVMTPSDYSLKVANAIVSQGPAIPEDENLSTVIYTFVFPEEMTEDGTIMSVLFEVADEAEAGEYTLHVEATVSDYDMNEYGFEAFDGAVEIVDLPDFLLGDINMDGRVSISDAVLMLRVASGDENLSVEDLDLVAANVTTEGDTDEMTVNTNDVIVVLQYLNGTIAAL